MKKVMIGIAVSLDAAHPVVAKTIKAEGGACRHWQFREGRW